MAVEALTMKLFHVQLTVERSSGFGMWTPRIKRNFNVYAETADFALFRLRDELEQELPGVLDAEEAACLRKMMLNPEGDFDVDMTLSASDGYYYFTFSPRPVNADCDLMRADARVAYLCDSCIPSDDD